MKKLLVTGIIAVLLLFFTMPISATLVINGIVSGGEGIWTEVAGNATYNGCVNISGYYYGNGSELTGITEYTDAEAVAAADASDKFIERDVENVMTGVTTLKHDTSGAFLQMLLETTSSSPFTGGVDLILKSTTNTYLNLYARGYNPSVFAEGTDVKKIIGYTKFVKNSGVLNSYIDFAIRDAAGNYCHPFYLYHDKIEICNIPITNIANPTNAQDAATKNYVDTYGPKRYNQSAEPILNDREMCIWRDTDDAKVYLIYKDEISGQKKVEMI